MGVIITIRNRFGYVIVGLIAIAIVGFLIMDTTNSRTGIFNRTSNNAGVVNGEEFGIQEYQQEVAQSEESMKQNSPDHTLPDDQRFTLNQQTWDNFVRKNVMGHEFNKLGVEVTTDELFDMLQGEHPHPFVIQNFGNPQTGKFDPSAVAKFVEKLDEDSPDEQMTSDERKKRWKNFQDYIKEDRLSTKYYSLIKKAIFVPDWEAKKLAELQQAKTNVDYVVLPFQSVSDSSVKVTDSDLKDYLNKHQAEFKQEESRAVEYVVFNLLPSPKDTAKILESLTSDIDKFKETKNDSLYIRANSSIPFAGGYQKKNELTSAIADTFFKVSTGTLVGPYLDQNAYVVAKLIDRKQIADSVQVAQIVLQLKAQADVEPGKAKADSLKKLAEGGADFAKLVAENSQDPQGKLKGGDLGFIRPDPKSPLNNSFFFDHKQGDVFVEFLGNTIRIFKITISTPAETAVKVAFLGRSLAPSSNSKDSIYAVANKFAGTYSTDEKFKNAGKEKAVRPSEPLTEGSYRINGVGTAREIIKWVFGANKGDVSPVFKLDDKYVVVHLNSVKEKGIAKIDDVRPELEQLVRKEKKADLLKAKIEGAKDLATIATKGGQSVKNAADVTFNNPVLEGATEPKVGSASLGLKAGEVSKPIVGNLGVYVVQVKELTPSPAVENLDQIRMMLSMGTQQRVQDQVFAVLKDAAKIKDERMKHNLY